jgi:hypothetical protein
MASVPEGRIDVEQYSLVAPSPSDQNTNLIGSATKHRMKMTIATQPIS